MNDDLDLSKIKERIAKLLNMASDASSPNEAAIAASRARKLMDKYQLSQLDIEDSVPEAFAAKHATRAYAALPHHLNVFSVAVAKYNDVQAVIDYGVVTHKQKVKQNRGNSVKYHGKIIMFRGYANDVDLAVNMFKSLIDAVDRLCREYVATLGGGRFPVGIGTEFKKAAILEITSRLREMTVERDRLTSTSTGTSLVLSKSLAVVEKFGAAGYKDVKTTMKADDESYAARQAGIKAGRAIEIVKSVETE